MNISTGAVGAELLAGRIRRVEAAPWEREGAGLHSPDDPQAREAAQRWSAAVATMDANERDTEVARVRREEARRHRREDEEAANAKKLENNAKRMFLIGFAGLPFVWLVSVLYFREELRNENANPNIKKRTYRSSCKLTSCSFCRQCDMSAVLESACRIVQSFVRHAIPRK